MCPLCDLNVLDHSKRGKIFTSPKAPENMDSMMVFYLDIAGTIVFAISGTLTALNNKFDLFGALVIAFVTATGGGTLRDLLLGASPVFWVQSTQYFLYIFSGYLLAIIFQSSILRLRKTMFLFDTLGIGIFTIIGLEKTLGLGFTPFLALNMGVMSAVFGGVTRDVLTNIPPLIFRKEIYATACYAGGVCYLLLEMTPLHQQINISATILLIILIRMVAIRRHWTLSIKRYLKD